MKDGLEECLQTSRQIKSRIARLKDIERMSEDGTFDVLPKKEVIQLKKEWDKLEKNLGGIKDMKTLPDAIFIVDLRRKESVFRKHTLLEFHLSVSLILTVIQRNLIM